MNLNKVLKWSVKPNETGIFLGVIVKAVGGIRSYLGVVDPTSKRLKKGRETRETCVKTAHFKDLSIAEHRRVGRSGRCPGKIVN